MSTAATVLIRQLAAHTLREFGTHVATLVLDPDVSLSTSDLETLTNTREVLLDAMFVGESRRGSRGLSGSTNHEQWSRSYPGGPQAFSASDARETLARLGHSLALLQRVHGPQPMEKCDLPHEHEGEGARG